MNDGFFKMIVLVLLFILLALRIADCNPRDNVDIYWKVCDVEQKVEYDVKMQLDQIERRLKRHLEHGG